MPKSSSSQQKRSAELAFVFEAHGTVLPISLRDRRDVAEQPPFRLALNKAASDEYLPGLVSITRDAEL